MTLLKVSFFEKLKKIKANISILNGAKFFTFNNVENHIHIDLSKANKQELKVLEKIKPEIRELITSSEDYFFESKETEKKLVLLSEYSESHSDDSEYNFVINKISRKDLAIWMSALLLKYEYDR